MKTYILISISPVQKYIEKSRKLKELKASSMIISDTIDCICEEFKGIGYTKIFPAFSSTESNLISSTNYAIMESNDTISLTERDLEKRFDAIISKDILNALHDYSREEDSHNLKINSTKISEIFTCYMVSAYGTYDEVSNILFQKLRKKKVSVFNFTNIFEEKSMSEKENGISSYYKSVNDYKVCQLCKERYIEVIKNNHKEKCHICEIKEEYARLKKISLESTEDISASYYYDKARMKNTHDDEFIHMLECIEKEDKLRSAYKSFYYKDLFARDTKELGIEVCEKTYNVFFEKFIKNKNITKYYAVIRIDADDMGSKLNFDYFNAIKNRESISDQTMSTDFLGYQKKLSSKLVDRCQLLIDYINEHKDTVKDIYIGGDDILLFCSIGEVLKILEIFSIPICFDDHYISFSSSVIYAHYNTSLSYVLKTGSESLKHVKEKYRTYGNDSKNAVVIDFITGSGAKFSTDFKNKIENTKLMETIVSSLNVSTSKSFVYKISDIILKMNTPMHYDDYLKFGKLLDHEIKRVLRRKTSKSDDKIYVDHLADCLTNFLLQSETKNSGNLYSYDVNNFIQFMAISEHIAKELYIDGEMENE